MLAFFLQHQLLVVGAAYFIFSNVVSAMPTPTSTSEAGYTFLFNLMHGLAANVGRIPAVRNILNGNAPSTPPKQGD